MKCKNEKGENKNGENEKAENEKAENEVAYNPARKIDVSIKKLSDGSRNLLELAEAAAQDIQEYYPELLDEEHKEQLERDIVEKTQKLEAAADMTWRAYQKVYEMGDELSARWADIRKSKRKTLFFSSAPANAAIDVEERGGEHFAIGLNFYKLFILCVAGSFFGVVIEVIWRLITKGVLESRVGLVYGPFNLLYGAGAVILTLFLYKYRNRSKWLSFAGGMLIGSAVEYLCSLGQELIFGSRSWDYSNVPFNVGGRICLMFSVFWGILGVLWIKDIYPRLTKWILKIPNRAGVVATWIFAVFFAVNIFVTVSAVYRWSDRISNVPASGAYWEIMDERFPDERMKKIFPSMKFANE